MKQHIPTFEEFIAEDQNYYHWDLGYISNTKKYDVYEDFVDYFQGRDERLDYMMEVLAGGNYYKPKCHLYHITYKPISNKDLPDSIARILLTPLASGSEIYLGQKKHDGPVTTDLVRDILSRVDSAHFEQMVNQLAEKIFDKMYMMGSLQIKNKKSNKRSRHVGHGSQSSTSVSTDVEEAYDVSRFIELFGQQKVEQWVAGSYSARTYNLELRDGVLAGKHTAWDRYD